MSVTPTFTPQLLGQTEKALNAILSKQLAGPGLTEPQWVTLTLTAMGGGSLDRDELIGRVAGALKVGDAEVQERIDELIGGGLLEVSGTELPLIMITDAGQELHSRIRSTVTEITERMWGDLPTDELESAARVLSTVLQRADRELARS